MNTKPLLVLGANGKTGRRVVERLRARNLPVRAASRSGETVFDWNNVGTWPAAVHGVDAVYITYYPDLAAPGASDAIRAFSELAVSAGVRRLVLLSGRGEPEAQRCEDIVRECGAEWTIVRASWFSQNFSENYLLEPLLAGEVAIPNGQVGEPFVDADDIADVVVAALTETRHAGQLYEVTGSRLWTFAQAVAEIARVTGREIRFVDIPLEQYEDGLRQAQLPDDLVAPDFFSVRRGARWAERVGDGWGHSCAWSPGARFRGLRARDRCDRRVGFALKQRGVESPHRSRERCGEQHPDEIRRKQRGGKKPDTCERDHREHQQCIEQHNVHERQRALVPHEENPAPQRVDGELRDEQ